MALDPIWTQDDLDTLKAAAAKGVLTVEYAGPPARKVTYQSLDAMLRLIDRMRRELNLGAPTYRLAATRKGLGA